MFLTKLTPKLALQRIARTILAADRLGRQEDATTLMRQNPKEPLTLVSTYDFGRQAWVRLIVRLRLEGDRYTYEVRTLVGSTERTVEQAGALRSVLNQVLPMGYLVESELASFDIRDWPEEE